MKKINKINKILSLVLSVVSLVMIPFSGCKDNNNKTVDGIEIKPSGTAYASDFSTLYGICETNVELYPEVDTALTTEWITHNCKAMGIKSYRIWAHIPMLFTVNEDDSITMNQDYADRINNFVTALHEAGVEKISMLVMERLHLAEDKQYAGSSVPDPTTDYDKYIRALAVEEKAYEMMGKEFPNIDYYESINEPDHYLGVGINKNGYVLNWNEKPAETTFEDGEETARVCMDFNWYQRRGLKKGNPNAKMMLPALCHFATTASFLEECYKAIYSRTMPAGQQYCDTDPDNYFDALNWHPYVNAAFGLNAYVDQLWIDRQNEIHDVAVKYGDAEKPVWMTEFGFTEILNNANPVREPVVLGEVTADGQTGLAPTNFILALETIKKELPWVEAFCMFRMTDMYNVKYDVAGENAFGMFYNPDDPEHHGKPKPAAVAVARYIKGGTLTYDDMKDLCKYYYDVNGDIPEEYKCVIK